MIVGALGSPGRARVDGRGRLTPEGEDWALDWWLGADDRWRIPAREPSVRQVASWPAPVSEIRARVPGGDAIQRVYGIGGPGGLVIVDVENASPAALVVALTVTGARSVVPDGAVLEVDGRRAVHLPFAPPRWTAGTDVLDVASIGASTGPMAPLRDRRRRVQVALLYPLSHRSRLRVAVATGDGALEPVDLPGAPPAEIAARGWAAVLDRGMRVVLPDPAETEAVDLARAQVLLDPDPGAATTAALEDWGFDPEAAWAWRGLSLAARRSAVRREGLESGDSPAALLLRTRRALVREHGDTIELLPASRWHGDLEVHDAPTRLGRVSYVLRSHGRNVALLWEVREPAAHLALRAPAISPTWSTSDRAGEALLTPA